MWYLWGRFHHFSGYTWRVSRCICPFFMRCSAVLRSAQSMVLPLQLSRDVDGFRDLQKAVGDRFSWPANWYSIVLLWHYMTLYGTMVWVYIGIHCYIKLYFLYYSAPYHVICTLGSLMVLVPMIYSTIGSRTILYNLVQWLFIYFIWYSNT